LIGEKLNQKLEKYESMLLIAVDNVNREKYLCHHEDKGAYADDLLRQNIPVDMRCNGFKTLAAMRRLSEKGYLCQHFRNAEDVFLKNSWFITQKGARAIGRNWSTK
jgi:hypothetical protein